jgi:hypothetical protein
MENKNSNMDHLQDTQDDMRNGYGNGATGVFISGIVWLISSLIVNLHTAQKGIWA